MKKTLFLIVALAITAFAFARPVKVGEGMSVAANYWHSAYHQQVQQVNLVPTEFVGFYVFDINEGSGFVIVSSDDLVYPILASSNNSTASNMGPETRFWLNQYEQEILAVVAGQVDVAESDALFIKNEWQLLRANEWSAPKGVTSVAQMLTTTWNQSPYYNDYCPSGTPVGCTATATAQVMKYWNHPAQGTGSHSYYSYSYGTLSADFGATTYEWDLMPNAVTSSTPADQRSAVALLSYHVGVAVEMSYGPDGSGAQVLSGYGASSEDALKTYFGYKSSIHGEYRSSYSDAAWVQMLKTELDAGRPIVYAGYDAQAGHAFVFDGYNTSSMFHVNWGWGGAYDGYYAMNALNPGGGGTGSNATNSFNQWNQALMGIEPIASLRSNPASMILSADAATSTIQITSAGLVSSSWHASVNVPWLSITPTSGSGSGAVTNVGVTASANSTNLVRRGQITVVQGSDTILVDVVQLACGSQDMCQLTVLMAGTNDNAWYGAYLSVQSADGVDYGMAKPRAGVYNEKEYQVCSDTLVLTWHSGTNDGACAFSLINGNGQVLLNHARQDVIHDGDQWVIVNPCAGNTGIDPQTFAISATTNDTLMGDVVGDGIYELGAECQLLAQARPGYRFTKWNDGSSLNPRPLTVTNNRTITATFASLGTDTIQFDNGTRSGSIGGGNDFHWAVRLDSESLVRHRTLTGVKFYVGGTGTYYVKVYSGDEEGPDSLLANVHRNVNSREKNAWTVFNFTTPLVIDHTKSLWIVLSTLGCNDPVAYANWCGNDEGSWFSEDGGTTWQQLSQLDQPVYGTWPIRAAVDYDDAQYTLTASSSRPSWGKVSGGGLYYYGQQATLVATPAEGCYLQRWTDNATENPHTVVVVSDTTIRAVFAQGEPESISDVDGSRYGVYAQGRALMVQGAEGMPVSIFDIKGRQVYTSSCYNQYSVILPAAGVYMVRVNNSPAVKVVVY